MSTIGDRAARGNAGYSPWQRGGVNLVLDPLYAFTFPSTVTLSAGESYVFVMSGESDLLDHTSNPYCLSHDCNDYGTFIIYGIDDRGIPKTAENSMIPSGYGGAWVSTAGSMAIRFGVPREGGGTSTITWPNPASIVYGTALGQAQLNATALVGSTSVDGAFVYDPPAGTVLSAGAGQVLSVVFTPTDTANHTRAAKTVTIDVTKATPTIVWTSPAGMSYGTALSGTQLNATASVAGTVVYTPPEGTVLAAGTHTLSVTFTAVDASNYTTVSTSVTIDVAKAMPIISWTSPSTIVYGTALSDTQLNATADVAGSFVYSPELGTTLNAGPGQTLLVTFTPTDSVNYSIATKTVTLDVAKVTPTIVWTNPAGITYGTALSATQLNATASVAGTIAYTPPEGTVLAAGTQTVSATFTAVDASNYTTVSTSVTIDVAKATPVIAWTIPSTIAYGTALSSTQLNATADVAGAFIYSPGLGTNLNAGPGQILVVTFTPTDSANYTTATKAVTIDVAKATPVITWATPAPIVYGGVLTATQLNASSGSVGGVFSYTPPSGTVMRPAGPQTLSVIVVPTDSSNYTTAAASVTLTVMPFKGPGSGGPTTGTVNGTTLTYSGLTYAIVNGKVTFPDCTVYIAMTSGMLIPAGTAAGCTPEGGGGGGGAVTPTLTWATPAAVVQGTALGATQLNATASAAGSTVSGTYTYTPPLGTVLNTVGTQTLSVLFTPDNLTAYTTATKSVSLVVTASGGTFQGPGTGGPATGSVNGTTLTYNGATYPIVNGKVTFPDCTVYIALGNGTLIPAGMAPDCTPGGGGGGGAVTPTLTWATPAAVVQGTALSATQLNATASASGATVSGTYTYTPPLGTAMNTVGTQTLSVLLTPDNLTAYTTATKSVSLVVTASGGTFQGPGTGGPATGSVSGSTLTYNGATYPIVDGKVTFPDCTVYIALGNGMLIPAGMASGCTPGGGGGGGGTPVTPTLTWATPASIVQGTALSGTQLNAIASAAGSTVSGTYTYTPPLGTVLNTVGTQTLSVLFTPDNLTAYTTATKSVSLVVTASGGTFQGPGTGGPATGTVSGTTLTYNGATYPIVNGKVTFPDCTVYIAMTSGLLIPAGIAPGCTPPVRTPATVVRTAGGD